MGNEYSLEVIGQKYFGNQADRTYTLYFHEPENGVSEETGICLLIAGFGGDANARVFRKMRREFADRENLVVIQCDYFGYEFMDRQMDLAMRKQKLELHTLLSAEELEAMRNGCLSFDETKPKKVNYLLPETREHFCEMGLFQAMDNLRAVKIVMDILEQNHLSYNRDRILCYGYSQGAYLAHLCNVLAPCMFSGIIDNSAWLIPQFLYEPRHRFSGYLVYDPDRRSVRLEQSEEAIAGETHVGMDVGVAYQGRKWIDDMEAYALELLYPQFENQAKIIAFHSTGDTIVALEQREKWIKTIPNATLIVPRDEEIDGVIFKSNRHGLGADFLELFYYVCRMDCLRRETGQMDCWEGASFSTSKYLYHTVLEDGVPVLKRNKK